MTVRGTYWTGAASAVDSWTIQDVVSNGTNGASTLTVSHSGTTGSAAVQVPLLSIGGTDVGVSRLGAASLALGNGTASDTTANLSFNKVIKYAGTATVSQGVILRDCYGRSYSPKCSYNCNKYCCICSTDRHV